MSDRVIETYHDGDGWTCRRTENGRPFASGGSRERMIAIGVEVARWNRLRHVVRNADGTIAEVNFYNTDLEPHHSAVNGGGTSIGLV